MFALPRLTSITELLNASPLRWTRRAALSFGVLFAPSATPN